jgi:maltokinase
LSDELVNNGNEQGGPDFTEVSLRELIAELTTELPEWLPKQRWFAGKDRPITAVNVLSSVMLLPGDPLLLHLIVEVEQDDRRDPYQLLIGSKTPLPQYLTASVIGRENGTLCYEASGDPDLMSRLLSLLATETELGALKFALEPGIALQEDLRARLITSQQSNTSLVFGNHYILKLFRRLTPGENPDLSLHRALARVECQHIAQPLGSISGDLAGESITIGVLQEFLPDAVDGWAMATTSVRDLLADPRQNVRDAGGDFSGEAQRLGHAVAEVHADLQRALGHQEIEIADFQPTIQAMRNRVDSVSRVVPQLVEFAPALYAAYAQLEELKDPVFTQFIHGDLHLGQVLRTVNGWLLIDFEGETTAPIADRTTMHSPLRDVSCMLRSFDYAAQHMLVGQPENSELNEQAWSWARYNRAAFCAGYAEAAADSIGGLEAHASLLRAFELDRAVYEIAYEQANRPEWLSVPLSSIARITQDGISPVSPAFPVSSVSSVSSVPPVSPASIHPESE